MINGLISLKTHDTHHYLHTFPTRRSSDLIAYPTTKIRVNATCRKCPHKVHRMEMKTLPTGSVDPKDRKSGSAGMPRPISYAVFCLKKKKKQQSSYIAIYYIN